MNPTRLEDLLRRLASGAVSVPEVMEALRTLPFETTASAAVDHHRALRTGAPEVIFGAGKTTAQIVEIARALRDGGHNVLCTRVDAHVFEQVCASLSPADRARARYHEQARCFSVVEHAAPKLGAVGVVCAGTSDLPVAEEAAVSADFFGAEVERITDVGVAGVHRLLSARERLERVQVLIVVAGMEGALPSVVGGLVGAPLIAVPTSVGYGASFGGVAALLGMLNSCASGITVVNIDNGFGAAAAAFRILRARDRA